MMDQLRLQPGDLPMKAADRLGASLSFVDRFSPLFLKLGPSGALSDTFPVTIDNSASVCPVNQPSPLEDGSNSRYVNDRVWINFGIPIRIRG